MASTSKHDDVERQNLLPPAVKTSSQMSVNLASQPKFNRSSARIRITDLPHEILAQIGELVKGGWQVESSIPNLRLTCWALYHAVSHHLLGSVTVQLTPSSLSRLVEISQHPEISRGVRSISIDLLSHSDLLASSLQSFIDYTKNRLSDIITQLEQNEEQDHNPYNVSIIKNLITKRTLWNSWLTSAEGDEGDPAAFLRQTHNSYRKLCVEQATVLERDKFVETVAAAIARMPLVKGLFFREDESNRGNWPPDWLGVSGDEEEALIRFSLLPVSWKTAADFKLGIPPTIQITLRLLGAIFRAGSSSLRHLNVVLARPEDFLSLEAPGGRELQDLTNAVANLKSFSIWPINDSFVYRYRQEPEDIDMKNSFLSAILNTNSLERLSIDLDEQREESEERIPRLISFTAMVRPRPWKRLSNLSMAAIPLHLIELQQLFEFLPPIMDSIYWESIRLLSGTWAEVLDLLRARTPDRVSIVMSNNELDATGTGEPGIFSTIVGGDSEELYSAVDYVSSDFGLNKAQAYIMGKLDQNPLRRRNRIAEEHMGEQSSGLI